MVPVWLDVDRGLVPDYVIADPKVSTTKCEIIIDLMFGIHL